MRRYAYIIAGTPRTGSNWLCAWLRGCQAGNPHEYVNRHQLDKWWGVMDRQNPPYVYALKLFWGHLVNTKETPAEYAHYIWRKMGGERVRWVYLRREDTVRQALSLARVRATNGKWTHPDQHGPVTPVTIPYDRAQIDRDIGIINAQNVSWLDFFDTHTITPLYVSYEMMQADVQTVIREVLAHIGLGVFQHVDIPLQKQAGQDVELLRQRYDYDRTAATHHR